MIFGRGCTEGQVRLVTVENTKGSKQYLKSKMECVVIVLILKEKNLILCATPKKLDVEKKQNKKKQLKNGIGDWICKNCRDDSEYYLSCIGGPSPMF